MRPDGQAVLTAREVDDIRVRLGRLKAICGADRKAMEQCRLVAVALIRAQRRAARIESKNNKSHAKTMEQNNRSMVTVSEPETMEGWLKARLDEMAAADSAFALKLASDKKSLDGCIKYIQGEIYGRYVKDRRGVTCAMPSRSEVLGLAVDYYDEENVRIRKLPEGMEARAAAVQEPVISEEEKERMKADAMARMEKQYEQDARRKIEEREKARRKAEREKAEQRRKAADGMLNLFDPMSL